MKTERRQTRLGVGVVIVRTNEELVAEVLKRKRFLMDQAENVRLVA